VDDIEDPVQLWFTSHVDTVYRSLDSLQPTLLAAGEALRDALLSDHRLLAAGSGAGVALAQIFATSLLNRLRMERPALPVLLLGNDAATSGAIAEGYGHSEVLARQIKAFCQPGDVVLLVAGCNAPALQAAARAAGGRGARLIVISSGIADAGSLPGPGDIELRVPADEPTRASECQLLLLNCLAELVERELFGVE
jgi:phosphoheptose isomerase